MICTMKVRHGACRDLDTLLTQPQAKDTLKMQARSPRVPRRRFLRPNLPRREPANVHEEGKAYRRRQRRSRRGCA